MTHKHTQGPWTLKQLDCPNSYWQQYEIRSESLLIGNLDLVTTRSKACALTQTARTTTPLIMEDADGNDIDGSTYYAYDKLDENPWVSTANTDYVRQTGNGTGNYCEIQFADTTNTQIMGVMALLEYAAASTSACTGGCIIRSNTTETTLWGVAGALADYSESSAFYKSVLVSPDGGSWSSSVVNALRCRFGYSDDANPDPYWLAIMLEVAYAPGVTLVVADAALAHAVDNVVLTQHNILAVQDSGHGHSAEGPLALTQHNVLAVQDSSHSHAVDNVTVTAHEPTTLLVVQDSSHAHAVDNVALTQHNVLADQDSAHAHAVDNVALTQHNILAVADAILAHSVDNVTVTYHAGVVLVVQDSSHGHIADSPALTQHNVLTVQDSYHFHWAYGPISFGGFGGAVVTALFMLRRGRIRVL